MVVGYIHYTILKNVFYIIITGMWFSFLAEWASLKNTKSILKIYWSTKISTHFDYFCYRTARKKVSNKSSF